MSTHLEVLCDSMEVNKMGIAHCPNPQCRRSFLVNGFSTEQNQRQADNAARLCCDTNDKQLEVELL
jgi:hypothetical protein